MPPLILPAEIKPDYCFYHIPKCMGTSLRKMLYSYFTQVYDREKVYVPGVNRKLNVNLTNQDRYNTIIAAELDIKVLLCHCNFDQEGISSQFSDSSFSITCVREPIDRMISHYYYTWYPTRPEKHKNYSSAGIFIHKLPKVLFMKMVKRNVITAQLSGGVPRGDINIALKNVDRINCILNLENIQEDVKHLNQVLNLRFGKDIKMGIEYVNINSKILKKKGITLPSVKDLELDRERILEQSHLITDLTVYNYIQNRK